MFEHSVKVPRHYKIAANIFKKVSTEGGSVKTLLYDDKLRHFRTNVLYALITETIKHAADLDKVFQSCSLLENESRLDPWLAKILATELLFGKKALPGQSKPEQTIITYKEKFETYLNENTSESKTKAVRRPRYVRINTNLLTTSDAIREFQDEGYRFIRCTSGSYDDYLKQIQELTEYDFTQDYHVKTVFVFAAGTKLHEHDLYLENKIILQDKATAMAVHLLSPEPGSTVLDMCAAPGMKTTQLAAFMRNEGKIYAVERNEKRYETLRDFVERTGSKCVETLHRDALEIRKGDCDDVQYILLDPSCSGSGMELCVHNYIEESRLAKLTSLQEKFLKHAMNAFPKAKKIVYSTCSLFPEENERVITNVVKTSRAKWRVQDVKELLKGQWNNFGSGMYGSMGARCMYARPEADLTTGFFLAVLERDPKDLERSLAKESVDVENEIKKNKRDNPEKIGVNDESTHVSKKAGKKRKLQSENLEENKPEVTEKTKKKKRDKKIDESNQNGDHFEEPFTEIVCEVAELTEKSNKSGKNRKLQNDNLKENKPELSHKSKKKKKDKKVDKSGQNDDNFEEPVTEIVCVSAELTEVQVTRKNKKRKNKDIDNNDIQHKMNGSNVIEYNEPITAQEMKSETKTKNKKKKNKHGTTELMTEDVNENSEQTKKKSNVSANDLVSSELKKTGSKRKKTINTDQVDLEPAILQDNEADDDIKAKKKKKKSKKSLGARIREETQKWDL